MSPLSFNTQIKSIRFLLIANYSNYIWGMWQQEEIRPGQVARTRTLVEFMFEGLELTPQPPHSPNIADKNFDVAEMGPFLRLNLFHHHHHQLRSLLSDFPPLLNLEMCKSPPERPCTSGAPCQDNKRAKTR